MVQPGPKGSPRLKLAALTLANNPELDTTRVLLDAGYKKKDVTVNKKKALSRQKILYEKEIEKKRKQKSNRDYYIKVRKRSKNGPFSDISSITNTPPLEAGPLQLDNLFFMHTEAPTTSTLITHTTSTISNIGPPIKDATITASKSSKATSAASGSLNKRNRILSSTSRRTPKQVNAFLAEKNVLDARRKEAYGWAVKQATQQRDNRTVAQICREATTQFDIEVKADTVRSLIRKNCCTISRTGPKGAFSDEELQTFEVAVLSYLSLSQANCQAEKKKDDLLAIIQAILQDAGQERKIKDAKSFWRRMQGRLAQFLNLDKECLIEMRRQFWTTYPNINLWYDGWEAFLLEKKFAVKGTDGTVEFLESQRRRIINLDETKLSLDGSDGGIGGRPANTIRVKDQFRTGTATNKSSCSSTLICGSNSAGEALPLVIIFSSDAANEANYRIRAGWLLGMPKVHAKFGHPSEQDFPARALVNEKGGTDARILNEVLKTYIDTLFPDACDQDGLRVVFKIDGGPGRLNIQMLAELRCRGIYLFPGVQNTTHVTQETDQNYGLFKSKLRKNLETLTSWHAADYRLKLSMHEANPALHPNPPMPSLSREDYPKLVGGSDDEPKLYPAFHLAFSREQILRAWEFCGAVPLTRKALSNPMVHPEVTNGTSTSEDESVTVIGKADGFDWKSATLTDIERENHAACDKLASMGIDSKLLRLNAPRAPTILHANRLPAEATEAQRVQALAGTGFNLSSMFYTVGSTSISSDEMMQAAELKALRERWQQYNSNRSLLITRKGVEDKAKACLERGQNPQRGWNVADLRVLLRWKMPTEVFQAEKVTSATREKLTRLWEQYKDVEVEEIIIPEELPEPTVPELQATEVGRAAQRNADVALKCVDKLSNEALANMIRKMQEELSSRVPNDENT